eukprot:Hpha_TRINITY_DN20788_c0_g1::TRINITY_DN20788_c0_g1_i1::g.33403::m.33403/K07555/ATPeAF1, ATPAF1, ATP11; ATP synthase mitochondrial F1 complex assembly factor 1
MAGKGIFKTAGKKCLDQIVKLHLFEKAAPVDIASMWMTHHEFDLQYWGRVIPSQAYDELKPRLRTCPHFVVPIFRDKGIFNMVTNYHPGHDDLVLGTTLQEWQEQGDSASVHMTLQFFTELQRSKGLVLARAELSDSRITKQDAMFVTQLLLKYYTMPDLYSRYVECFNRRSNEFDYHAYLRQVQQEAKVETRKGGNVVIGEKSHKRILKPPPGTSLA